MRLAIVGKMRSGKDSVASIFINKFGYKKLAFADGITEIIDKFFPESYSTGTKPREHYQKIGQELRKINQNVWINYLDRRLSQFDNLNVIVSDCRQKNEEIYLREKGFILIKVIADTEIRLQRIANSGESVTLEQLNHESESQVDSIQADYIIVNNGTYEELTSQIIYLYHYLLHKERE